MYITSDKSNQLGLKVITSKTEKSELKLQQRVKVGDLLKAEIIDSVQKQIKLLLADGTIFKAQLNQRLDTFIGQKVTLEVIELLGHQIVMEITTPEGAKGSREETGVENIIKELNLPVTPDAKEIIKTLMERMLPITKENIQQTVLGLKTSTLPLDKLISMLENELPITSNTLSKMEAYHNGEIKLQAQMQNVIEHIGTHNDLKLLEEIYLTLITNGTIQEDTSRPSIKQEVALFPEQEAPSSKQLLGEQTALENQIEIESKETNPKTMEGLLSKDIIRLKEEITNMFNELFFISPEELKKGSESKLQQINELYKTIYEITDNLEKVEKNMLKSPSTEVYSEVKSNIEFLTMVSKYDTMLQLPLMVQNNYRHGEIYVFHKKKGSKQNYNEASLLVSLDTSMLGKVQVYVKKHHKQISCQFRLDDEEIEKIIKDNILSLKQKLYNIGYELSSVNYISNSQPFSVREDAQGVAIPGRYKFDTKI